ncbi:hypothetical protein CKJ90_32310, partial [Klebsiella pneumoniae]
RDQVAGKVAKAVAQGGAGGAGAVSRWRAKAIFYPPTLLLDAGPGGGQSGEGGGAGGRGWRWGGQPLEGKGYFL